MYSVLVLPFYLTIYDDLTICWQQKLAKRDGTQIDRSRDVERLWNFYLSYKRRHRVDDIQREEQKWRETGTFSSNLGEYDQLMPLYEFPSNLVVCCPNYAAL